MTRINDNMLDCVIYLYPTVTDAQQGIRAGGTGFLVGVPSEEHEEALYPYAITNSHVVSGRHGNSPVIRLNTHANTFTIIDKMETDWVYHPDGDDVAATPLSLNMGEHRFAVVNTNDFLTHDMVRQFSVGPGEDVVLVGRFVSHEGIQQNQPTARFGSISMMPIDPVKHMFGHMQESFLVEMHSSSGYSGSPVFLHPPLLVYEGYPGVTYPYLLGIDYGHLTQTVEIERPNPNTKQLEKSGEFVSINTGISTVIPAWKIKELLNMSVFKAERKAEDAKLTKLKAQSSLELDVALPSQETSDTFTKADFEDALRKVSKRIVPKTDDEGE